MNSVGIDLHRNRSHFAVIDGYGELKLCYPDYQSRSVPLVRC
jgi:hypothetical protein